MSDKGETGVEDNVVKFYPEGSAKDPDKVLEQAIGVYSEVFIIGKDKEGFLDIRASLGLDVKDTLLMLETFKFRMLRGDYYEDEDED